MQKGIFRRYVKYALKKIYNFIKNYIKDIIDEINVKSFKKYKYNFFFEFIGSFIFVFFISIYMLNSNKNEEYVIKHTKQVNPYQRNDIFIPGDNLFDSEINNVKYPKYVNDMNDQLNAGSILLERDKKNSSSVITNTQNKYKKLQRLEDNKVLENSSIINNLKRTGNIGKSEDEMKTDDTQKNKTIVVGENKYFAINNTQADDQSENNNEYTNKDDNSSYVGKLEQGKEIHKNENDIKGSSQNWHESEANEDKNTIIPSLPDEKKKIDEEEIIKNSKVYDKNVLTLNVDTVIFKDKVNEFTKIKVNDINNIDIGNIDQYEVLKSFESRNSSNHAIYSFFGCLIYVLFILLGAHINPAYTYALWLVDPKKYGFALTTFYVTFQYFGGILASILCAHVHGSILIYSLLPKKEIMKTFLCEFISTFLITLLLLSLYNYKKKFTSENKNEESIVFNRDKIKNLASFYSSSLCEDMYGCDMFNNTHNSKKKIPIHIDNKYIKYIMNHIFYLLFIFFSLLFFVFVTNTTLNPMFSTSTLYTYLYFKFFKGDNTFNIYSVILSFLSITKILQLIKLYIQSLPLWIGPYVGSALATSFMRLFKESDEEIIDVIDTNVYNSNNKKNEKIPLINKYKIKKNAYLEEYNNHMHYNSNNYLLPSVF
ncbi:aquaporin [Plasmodium brasilianum]|nr:aquaporin [Plasmodium brasilianum]